MEKTQVNIKQMSITPLGKGKESANYKTTIPLKVADEDAEAAIEEITHQIAEQVYAQWCDATGKHFAKEDPWSWFRYAPHSMTLDINGDCYCFTAEYPSNVTEYVRNAPEWNIEIEV